jgi:hypothetical protein
MIQLEITYEKSLQRRIFRWTFYTISVTLITQIFALFIGVNVLQYTLMNVSVNVEYLEVQASIMTILNFATLGECMFGVSKKTHHTKIVNF